MTFPAARCAWWATKAPSSRTRPSPSNGYHSQQCKIQRSAASPATLDSAPQISGKAAARQPAICRYWHTTMHRCSYSVWSGSSRQISSSFQESPRFRQASQSAKTPPQSPKKVWKSVRDASSVFWSQPRMIAYSARIRLQSSKQLRKYRQTAQSSKSAACRRSTATGYTASFPCGKRDAASTWRGSPHPWAFLNCAL